MKKPRVILFNSVSLDGRMDTGAGEIEMGIYYQTAAFWKPDAMLSGSATILAALQGQDDVPGEADPSTKELHPLAVPYLVVADSRGQIRRWRTLQAQPYWKQVIALCSQSTPGSFLAELDNAGVPYLVHGEDRIDFSQALPDLNARYGIETIRVDSGGVLNGVLLSCGLVDEVSLLIWPSLAGSGARLFYDPPQSASPQGIIRLKLTHLEEMDGGPLWVRYEVQS